MYQAIVTENCKVHPSKKTSSKKKTYETKNGHILIVIGSVVCWTVNRPITNR